MQKIIFGIFAHPDDEAFGPCGTLLLETRAGAELHLICLTNGDGQESTNPDNVSDLGEVRLQEWRDSTTLLHAATTHHLGYTDGQLNNNDQIKISRQIEEIVKKTVANRSSESYEVEFISFDLNGLTGHIDHIVTSRSACQAFYSLKNAGLSMARIRLFCLSQADYPTNDTTFVFMEPGRQPDEIDEIIDASSVTADIHAIMNCHKSQRADQAELISRLGNSIAINHFIVKK